MTNCFIIYNKNTYVVNLNNSDSERGKIMLNKEKLMVTFDSFPISIDLSQTDVDDCEKKLMNQILLKFYICIYCPHYYFSTKKTGTIRHSHGEYILVFTNPNSSDGLLEVRFPLEFEVVNKTQDIYMNGSIEVWGEKVELILTSCSDDINQCHKMVQEVIKNIGFYESTKPEKI